MKVTLLILKREQNRWLYSNNKYTLFSFCLRVFFKFYSKEILAEEKPSIKVESVLD